MLQMQTTTPPDVAPKPTLIFANLVYGQLYPDLWANNHLKSLLDPTNLPALRDAGHKLEYAIFTDDQTLNLITRHPHFIKLSELAEIHVIKIGWPADADQFNSRYGLLAQMCKQMVQVALEQRAWLACGVADLVFAKHALPRILRRLEDGHDAVFNVPIRGACDSLNPVLGNLPGAPSDLELFEMCYASLHHLWVASHWDAPQFTRMPYSIVWNSGSGLLTHNLGVTPIMFKPSAAMKAVEGGIDSDLPGFFKNPYWATDWTDAPVAGVEPLSNGHYPPFTNERANPERIAKWAAVASRPEQADYLTHPLYYPSRERFNHAEVEKLAAETALHLQNLIRHTKREP